MTVFELRVSLLGAEPVVWRRILVPEDADLPLIHIVLQMAMGWENCHLHEFVSADRKRYGVVDEVEPQSGMLDEAQYLLTDLVSEPGDRCLYIYDFGDDWVHEIVLEAVSEAEFESEAEQFRCLAGEGACPPENCGGVPGYLELLEKFNDLDAVGHDEAVDLLGEEFDPEAFDCSVFDERIAALYARFQSGSATDEADEEVDEEMALIYDLLEFLESDVAPESTMSIFTLDGFFAALAIHPVAVMPSTWLPMVWDMSGSGHQPNFSSATQAEKGMGLLFMYMNSVLSQLTGESADYAPLFEIFEIDSPDEMTRAATEWSIGFMFGAMIDEEVWERTFADEEGRKMMLPFMFMSGINDKEIDIDDTRKKEIREELIDELYACVLDLQEFWEPWRTENLAKNAPGGTKRSRQRVGRNDPCPCGSGKKFKQCCGK